VRRTDKRVTVEFAGDALARWRVQLANIQTISLHGDFRMFTDPAGVVLEPGQGSRTLEFELEPSPS
jgi:hypothetical protein